MPIKAVQVLKGKLTTVRYRDAKGKTMNVLVTATSGAPGVLSLRNPHRKQLMVTKSKATTVKGVDVYDNRH